MAKRMSEEAFVNLGWIQNRTAELQEDLQQLNMLAQMVAISETPEPKDQWGRPISVEHIIELKNEVKVRLTKEKNKVKKTK